MESVHLVCYHTNIIADLKMVRIKCINCLVGMGVGMYSFRLYHGTNIIY